ncbi:MAG TPA: cytochrome P450 [Polyangium sp.]|nr:cytochrome P450 [Polyangium sp.]
MSQNDTDHVKQVVNFQPYAPGYDEDPYPAYKELREKSPIHYWPEMGGWLVSRYADLMAILRDKRFSTNRKHWEHAAAMQGIVLSPELEEVGRNSLSELDETNHARVRRLIAPALNFAAIERLAPEIQRIVDDRLDKLPAEGTVNVIDGLADHVPAMITGTMFNLPKGTETKFYSFTAAASKVALPGLVDPAEFPGVLKELHDGLAMIRELVDDRRRNPIENDILTGLIHTEEQGDRLSNLELLGLISHLTVAGFEPTKYQVAFTVYNMLRRPEVFRDVKADPTLVKGLVEEILRYDNFAKLGPPRFATEDVEIGGVTIKKGAMVMLLLSSGLRDASAYENADEFDIRRTTNANLAFGFGAHFCLGIHLLRMTVQIVIETLVRRFPDMELAGTPVFSPHPQIRRIVNLPVNLRPLSK